MSNKELAAVHDLTKQNRNEEREAAFRACADSAEHERQIALYAPKIEKELHSLFETASMSVSDMLALPEGRELAAALGPQVLMTHRDAFWVSQVADLYKTEFGTPVYYIRTKDNPLAVVSASTTDGGAVVATAPLVTGKGYDTPVDIMHRRLVLTASYDSPKLAESRASSRVRALDLMRYKLNKAYQDMVIAALAACEMASIPTNLYHDLPAGRVHPTTNKIDATTEKLSINKVKELSKYFATFGWDGQIVLFVSDLRFEDVKGWASATTITDLGGVFAEMIANGRIADTAQFGNILIVKKNNVPDNYGYALCVSDGGFKTLGVYQFGNMQSLPSTNSTSQRTAFDMVIPGVAGVCHDALRTAFMNF
jgi:hypothetical protein